MTFTSQAFAKHPLLAKEFVTKTVRMAALSDKGKRKLPEKPKL